MFNLIFKKRKLKTINSIEEKYGVSFPLQIKEFIKTSNLEETFKLPDEEYKILESLIKPNVDNKLDDFPYLIDHLNSGTNTCHFRKIPFARNVIAGKDKYLVFNLEKNKGYGIYITDNNAIINQLEITPFINIFKKTNIFNLQLLNDYKLPVGIKYWDGSFEHTKSLKELKESKLTFESHGTYYKTSLRKENIAKLEFRGTLNTSKFQFLFSSAYEIENPEIDLSLKYLVDSRMYYYHLICLTHLLNLFINANDSDDEIISTIANFNLYEKAKNILKSQSSKRI